VLPAKRRALILEAVRREAMVSLKDLSDRLGMSLSTVRRDVDYLAQSGHIERTHGGAMLSATTSPLFEPEAEIGTAVAAAAKEAIGRHAAGMIQPGHCVIFDSGSTTAAAARAAVARRLTFTAFTNDLHIAALLATSPSVTVHVPGGRVRPGSATILGSAAVASVGLLRADLAFVGTHAITPEDLSDTSIELADLKRAIIAAADRAILLVDSSKLFQRAFCSFGSPSAFHLVITDSQIGADDQAALLARGVILSVVAEAP
jgi:DeoR family transcriptional regulator, aga operon transcriptional repressor